MITLRPYQEDIVKKVLWAKDLPGNDVVCAAQGSGKSLIIAEVAHRLGKPVLIICPNKEILEQDIEKMSFIIPREEIGVFSASLNEKNIKQITFGTIQSMYKVPELFAGFDVVIYDECDLHNPKTVEGMSSQLFKKAGIKKVFGFTGTPFRQDTFYQYPDNYKGLIWQKAQIKVVTTTKMINRYKSMFWTRMLCVINTQELLDLGYLSPIEYHDVKLVEHEELKTNKSQSDFDLEDFEEKVCNRYTKIAKFIETLPHRSKLVFTSSIQQAEALQSLVEGSVVVTSETTKKARAKAVEDLKAGRISVVFNVGIFTVGFDYPELDCICLLRPTRSLRLHCQILGRVSRIAPGKTCGHVYDLVSNVKNMGKLNEIKVAKDSTGKWNVMGGKYPDGFHLQPLFTYAINKKYNKDNEN